MNDFVATLKRCLAAICASTLLAIQARAAGHPPLDIDRLATRAMHEFSVPGLAVGVVKNGRLVFAKGYGTRELGRNASVDADTLFAIGSNTKAFTAASLAILVGGGGRRGGGRGGGGRPGGRGGGPWV